MNFFDSVFTGLTASGKARGFGVLGVLFFVDDLTCVFFFFVWLEGYH